MVKQYQVVISKRAQESLDQIVEYITENKSFDAAMKMERRLLEKIQTLNQLPDRGAHLKLKRKRSSNPYRFILEKRYKIIYTVEEQPKNQVIIIELFHGRRSRKTLDKSLP